ncbi:DUF5683 domain-containing protein [Chloroherpeton thalassium]|nr:DUF5683 domain-containing protein [Chloroherpeton thalassium]
MFKPDSLQAQTASLAYSNRVFHIASHNQLELNTTALFDTLQVLDSVSVPLEQTNQRMTPWKVSLYAALIPGFGQIYNEVYWKVPILYGFLGWYGYNIAQKHDKYIYYRNLYLANQSSAKAESYRNYRDLYHDSRDEYIIYLLLAYLAGIVDAYVDAHLYDFDVDDDLTAVLPKENPSQIQLVSLKIRF